MAVLWGLESVRLYIYGKPIELLTNRRALEQLFERNRSDTTYSTIPTRWLDRLAHFDIEIKHVAGKYLSLTDYFGGNPIANREPIENYDDEYVMHCVLLLHEFINNDSIIHGKDTATRTDETNDSHQMYRQSNTKHVQKIWTSDNKHNSRSQLLTSQS